MKNHSVGEKQAKKRFGSKEQFLDHLIPHGLSYLLVLDETYISLEYIRADDDFYNNGAELKIGKRNHENLSHVR